MKQTNDQKIKVRSNRIILLVMVAIIMTAVSCHQEKEQAKISQDLSPVIADSYYNINYHCFDFVKQCELEMLKLVKRDTLVYVKSSQAHGQYEEIHGKLTRINDSIYYVEPFRHFEQRGNGDKPLYMRNDTVFFFCDSSLIGSNLRIEYQNGQIEKHIITSTETSFGVNGEYFNEENERIYISFDYKNPLVDETVEIVSKYSDIKYSIGFISIKKSDSFYVVIDDKEIKTLNKGTRGHQSIGPKFQLDKLPTSTKLPGNRKLYK